MVATVEKHATDTGVAVLESGGNAVDAAVAVGLALAVTHGHPLDMNYAVAKSVDTPWGPPPSAVPDLGDPMEWLIEERNDIVAEVQHAHEAGHWPYAWGLANILDPVFILSSQGPQSYQVKELALSAARAAGNQRRSGQL